MKQLIKRTLPNVKVEYRAGTENKVIMGHRYSQTAFTHHHPPLTKPHLRAITPGAILLCVSLVERGFWPFFQLYSNVDLDATLSTTPCFLE